MTTMTDKLAEVAVWHERWTKRLSEIEGFEIQQSSHEHFASVIRAALAEAKQATPEPIFGKNYDAGLWSRRNLEAYLEDQGAPHTPVSEPAEQQGEQENRSSVRDIWHPGLSPQELRDTAIPHPDRVKAEPLTEEQMMRALVSACDSLSITRVHELGGKTRTIMEDAGLLEIGRAIEAAHGIGVQKEGE